MFESVNRCTDRRTGGRQLESHPISSPMAFGSGEPIIQVVFNGIGTSGHHSHLLLIHSNTEVILYKHTIIFTRQQYSGMLV